MGLKPRRRRLYVQNMGSGQGHRPFVFLLGIIGAAVGWYLGSPAVEPFPTVDAPVVPPTFAQSTFPVHVSGWVISPGLVWLMESDLVADAIAAAGGVRPGALLDQINLAQPVGEGDQIHVPGPGERLDPGGTGGNGSDGLIDLNTADTVTLQQLPGVGPVLAQRIVDYREAHGGFESIEDLLDVAGIGETRLASIRDLIKPP